MAIVLVATPGAATANSYATLAEVDAYALTRPVAWDETSVWDDADTDDKNRAIVTAAWMLDEYVEWDGSATDDIQAMAWPRVGMVTPNGYTVEHTEIPERLKRANAELAMQLLITNRAADSEADTQGLKKLDVGPISLEFAGSIEVKAISDRVWRMIALWGVLKQRSANIPLVRV